MKTPNAFRLPDHARALRLQPGCKLSGLPGIVCDFTDSEALGSLQDICLDPIEIDDIAGCGNQLSLRRPSSIHGLMRQIERSFGHIETTERYQLSVSLEEEDHSRNIGFGGEIDRNEAGLAIELIEQ